MVMCENLYQFSWDMLSKACLWSTGIAGLLDLQTFFWVSVLCRLLSFHSTWNSLCWEFILWFCSMFIHINVERVQEDAWLGWMLSCELGNYYGKFLSSLLISLFLWLRKRVLGVAANCSGTAWAVGYGLCLIRQNLSPLMEILFFENFIGSIL